MADVKWIKITTDLFDDEKIKLIDVLPERDAIIVIWFKLLTLAGKTNDNGLAYIMKEMATTDEVLATVFNRPINTVRLALNTFKRFKMVEINDHINVINWEKHQNVEGLDKIREQTKKRVAKYRAKKIMTENKLVTLQVTNSNATELELELELDKNKNKNKIRIDTGYEEIKNYWNSKNNRKIKSLSKKRKDGIKLRIKENSKKDLLEAIDKISTSKFCTGTNDNNWKAGIDWLIKNDTNIIKVLEGNYDDKESGSDNDKKDCRTIKEKYAIPANY